MFMTRQGPSLLPSVQICVPSSELRGGFWLSWLLSWPVTCPGTGMAAPAAQFPNKSHHLHPDVTRKPSTTPQREPGACGHRRHQPLTEGTCRDLFTSPNNLAGSQAQEQHWRPLASSLRMSRSAPGVSPRKPCSLLLGARLLGCSGPQAKPGRPRAANRN